MLQFGPNLIQRLYFMRNLVYFAVYETLEAG